MSQISRIYHAEKANKGGVSQTAEVTLAIFEDAFLYMKGCRHYDGVLNVEVQTDNAGCYGGNTFGLNSNCPSSRRKPFTLCERFITPRFRRGKQVLMGFSA